MVDAVSGQNEHLAPFWSAAARGELRFPKCLACGRFHWYPMRRCPHCQGTDVAWTEVKPVGTVFTWTVVRHAFDPSFHLPVPYVVAIVEFESAPGVRLVTNVVDGVDEVHIGMPVEAVFDSSGDQARVYVRRRDVAGH